MLWESRDVQFSSTLVYFDYHSDKQSLLFTPDCVNVLGAFNGETQSNREGVSKLGEVLTQHQPKLNGFCFTFAQGKPPHRPVCFLFPPDRCDESHLARKTKILLHRKCFSLMIAFIQSLPWRSCCSCWWGRRRGFLVAYWSPCRLPDGVAQSSLNLEQRSARSVGQRYFSCGAAWGNSCSSHRRLYEAVSLLAWFYYNWLFFITLSEHPPLFPPFLLS